MMSSFDRGEVTAALNRLSAFQNKVRAQVVRWNPVLASEFTAASQQIIMVERALSETQNLARKANGYENEYRNTITPPIETTDTATL